MPRCTQELTFCYPQTFPHSSAEFTLPPFFLLLRSQDLRFWLWWTLQYRQIHVKRSFWTSVEQPFGPPFLYFCYSFWSFYSFFFNSRAPPKATESNNNNFQRRKENKSTTRNCFSMEEDIPVHLLLLPFKASIFLHRNFYIP